jgi:hypothetical protein
MIKELAVLLVLLAVLVIGGCVSRELNSNPPDYIKNIYLGKTGSDGIYIYFVLGDKQGASTASDGKLTINITDDSGTLLEATKNVTKSDFIETTDGMGGGNFAHPIILLNIGRIPYSSMTRKPSGLSLNVIISFVTPDGRKLSGDATIML